MVQQSTNTIFENVYKFNGKELDEQTGYYYYGARYYDPGASIFLSVDPLAEDFPNFTPYHYVHNNPINLIDPTGMSAETYDQDPPKNQSSEPKKVLNIKFYGEDKSLYYNGEAFSFGSGGFNFTTEKESRGDVSLLVGNSGQGDYLNADAFLQAADFSKSFSKGTNFGSNKGIVEYLGNIIEGLNKGMNVGEKFNEIAKASNANQSSEASQITMQRDVYSIVKPDAYNGARMNKNVKDTIVEVKNKNIIPQLNSRDSVNEHQKMKAKYYKNK